MLAHSPELLGRLELSLPPVLLVKDELQDFNYLKLGLKQESQQEPEEDVKLVLLQPYSIQEDKIDGFEHGVECQLFAAATRVACTMGSMCFPCM